MHYSEGVRLHCCPAASNHVRGCIFSSCQTLQSKINTEHRKPDGGGCETGLLAESQEKEKEGIKIQSSPLNSATTGVSVAIRKPESLFNPVQGYLGPLDFTS